MRGRGRASPIRNHERSPCHAAVLDIDDLVVDSDRFDTIARPLVGPRDPPSKANWNRTHRRRQDGCIPRPDRVHARDPPVAGSCRLGRGGARRHRRGRGADALHLEATDGATVPARGGTGLRVRVAAPRADRERIASGSRAATVVGVQPRSGSGCGSRYPSTTNGSIAVYSSTSVTGWRFRYDSRRARLSRRGRDRPARPRRWRGPPRAGRLRSGHYAAKRGSVAGRLHDRAVGHRGFSGRGGRQLLRGATAAAARMSEPKLTDALHRAADRDVFVQLLCERRTDNPGFNGDSSPFPNLRARRLCWPAAKTPCRGVDACQGACDR